MSGGRRSRSWPLVFAVACTASCLGIAWLTPQLRTSGSLAPRATLAQPLVSSAPQLETRTGGLAAKRGGLREVAGVIRRSAGAGLPGARICTVRASDESRESADCSDSRADGHFRFTVHDTSACLLVVSASGYLGKWVTLPSADCKRRNIDHLSIELIPADAEVAGRVVDATGGPVAGARVDAQVPGLAGVLNTALTDPSGRFSLSVSKGTLELSAEAEGYSKDQRVLEAPASGLMMVLVPASSILGRVMTAEGDDPVTGLVVAAQSSGGGPFRQVEALSGADGAFRVDALPAGTYFLHASSDEWTTNYASIRLGIGQVTDGVLLEARRAVGLEGSITVEGQPCSVGDLSLSGPRARFTSVMQAGQVAVRDLAPGKYTAEVYCDGAVPVNDVVEVGGASLERHWDLRRGLAVVGVVESASGQPLSGARVGIQRRATLSPPGDPAQSQRMITCPAEIDGSFRCAGLDPGNYECLLLDRRSEPVRVALSDKGAPPVVLRAAALGSIRASLTSSVTPDLDKMAAFVQGAHSPPRRMQPMDGGFGINDLPLGEYRAFMGSGTAKGTAPGARGNAIAVLDRDGQVAEVHLSLPETTLLAGQVLDEQRQPVPDAWVRVNPAESQVREAAFSSQPVLTDDEGYFSVEGLALGLYDVHVSAPSGAAVAADVRAGSDSVVVTLPTYGSLEGFLERGGRPVPSFDITYESEATGSETATGAAGRWSIPWLPPGSYRLSAAIDGATVTRLVQLEPGQRLTLNLELGENGAEADPDRSRGSSPSQRR